jgi:hypothetical protein
MDNFFRLRVVCKRWNSFVFSLGFLTDCPHVNSLVSSFSLLPTPASRPTFYSLSDPAPTSAPSKKIPLWDFPQGSVLFLFFCLLCLLLVLIIIFPAYFCFLLVLLGDLFFSHRLIPRFFFLTPTNRRTPPPPPPPPTYKTKLLQNLPSFWD